MSNDSSAGVAGTGNGQGTAAEATLPFREGEEWDAVPEWEQDIREDIALAENYRQKAQNMIDGEVPGALVDASAYALLASAAAATAHAKAALQAASAASDLADLLREDHDGPGAGARRTH